MGGLRGPVRGGRSQELRLVLAFGANCHSLAETREGEVLFEGHAFGLGGH